MHIQTIGIVSEALYCIIFGLSWLLYVTSRQKFAKKNVAREFDEPLF